MIHLLTDTNSRLASIFPILQFLKYKLNAVSRHSLHSPFLYDFYMKVLKSKEENSIFSKIEVFRNELLQNERLITINDFGAGSRVDTSPKRKIKAIAKSALSTKKFSEVLFRIAKDSDAKQIIELGTSLGINTLYLSAVGEKVNVTTFEGCEETADVASELFKNAQRKNIEMIVGNINETLPQFLKTLDAIDLVYFDANHQYQSTMDYYRLFKDKIHDKTIFIFDDIHWSKGMNKAWVEIINLPEVTLSLDIYDAGIVFFDQRFTKEHYVLDF